MADLSEQEAKLWEQVRSKRGDHGTPQAICSAITPFPFWGVIVAIVVFIPLALVLSFFLKRHALIAQGGELVAVDLSFWRMRPTGETLAVPLGAAAVSLEGQALVVDGRKYHLQPGWDESAARIVALAG